MCYGVSSSRQRCFSTLAIVIYVVARFDSLEFILFQGMYRKVRKLSVSNYRIRPDALTATPRIERVAVYKSAEAMVAGNQILHDHVTARMN